MFIPFICNWHYKYQKVCLKVKKLKQQSSLWNYIFVKLNNTLINHILKVIQPKAVQIHNFSRYSGGKKKIVYWGHTAKHTSHFPAYHHTISLGTISPPPYFHVPPLPPHGPVLILYILWLVLLIILATLTYPCKTCELLTKDTLNKGTLERQTFFISFYNHYQNFLCHSAIITKSCPFTSRYIIASQDPELRAHVHQQVMGTPILYLHQSAPTLEKPTEKCVAAAQGLGRWEKIRSISRPPVHFYPFCKSF